ncbi:hypothetical protein B0I35DRAFT_442941 [Stachybotrys elegans]|uniref:Uncharacterized protein n=1 Tax=Stachybotrys elegans TaxID=80388 RepID=A0A8K0SFT8_9HYPO|nr:hypothetical protein B0I35DRAFT_442941 [Stachybotrys elegans]
MADGKVTKDSFMRGHVPKETPTGKIASDLWMKHCGWLEGTDTSWTNDWLWRPLDAFFLGYWSYSPVNIRNLPPPVPNDLDPAERKKGAVLWDDAFEDLLRISLKQQHIPISWYVERRKYRLEEMRRTGARREALEMNGLINAGLVAPAPSGVTFDPERDDWVVTTSIPPSLIRAVEDMAFGSPILDSDSIMERLSMHLLSADVASYSIGLLASEDRYPADELELYDERRAAVAELQGSWEEVLAKSGHRESKRGGTFVIREPNAQQISEAFQAAIKEYQELHKKPGTASGLTTGSYTRDGEKVRFAFYEFVQPSEKKS